MDILIHSDGLRLNDQLKSTIEEKIGRIEQYEPRAVRARLHLRRESANHHSDSQYVVRVLVELPGRDLAAEEKASKPLEALDLLVDKIEQQLSKRKTARLAKRTKAKGIKEIEEEMV